MTRSEYLVSPPGVGDIIFWRVDARPWPVEWESCVLVTVSGDWKLGANGWTGPMREVMLRDGTLIEDSTVNFMVRLK